MLQNIFLNRSTPCTPQSKNILRRVSIVLYRQKFTFSLEQKKKPPEGGFVQKLHYLILALTAPNLVRITPEIVPETSMLPE